MSSQSKIRAIFLFSVIAVVSVFGFADALSQWQFNQDFKVSDNYVGSGNGYVPQVAMSNSGNSVVIWREEYKGLDFYYQIMDQNNWHVGMSTRIASAGHPYKVGMNSIGEFSIVCGGTNLKLKRFASDGTPLGDDIKVNESDLYCSALDYAMNDDGKSVVVWKNIKDGYKNIYGQYYDSDATPQGNNFLVTDDTSRLENCPAVAMDSQGNFVALWVDSTSGNSKLFGKRYDSSSNLLGSNFLIDEWQGFSEYYDFPALSMNDQGYFLVCWHKKDQLGHRNLYGLLFDPQGNPTGIQYQIDNIRLYPYAEKIDAVLFNDNSSVIMWGPADYQRFASDGSPIGEPAHASQGQGMPEYACIAGDDANNFLFAWDAEARDIGLPYYIRSQRYFSDGQRNGPNMLVGRTIPTNARYYHPSISCNNQGNFVIAWDGYRNESSENVYAQMLGKNGEFIRNNFDVRVFDFEQNSTDVAVKADGSFLVLYLDNLNCGGGGAGGADLRINWYDANGIINAQSTVTGCNALFIPKAEISPTGDYIIVWTYLGAQEDGGKIYCRMYTANYSLIGANFEINDPVDNQINCQKPSLGIDCSGNFVVVWDTDLNGNSDIYGKIFNSEGIPYQANFMINDDGGSSNQTFPAVAMHSDGSFVVTWTDTREGNNDIFAQRYDSNWNPIGNNFLVSDGGLTSNQSNPAIAFTPDGKFVIAWQDYRNGNDDIYAQKFNADGSKIGGNYRVNDDEDSADQSYPQVDCNSENIYFTWQDNRIPNEDYDIFARVEPFSGEQHVIVIQQPEAGDKWIIGTTNRITWNSSDLGGTLLIELSTDNGFSWKTISSNTPFDAAYVEYTPSAAELSDHCFIKITSNDFPTVSDFSDRFNIFKPIKRYTAKQFSITSDPITLDGMLSEGVWNDAKTDSLLFGGIPEEWTSNWTNCSDLVVTWKALWSPENNRVYIALQIQDDIRGTLDNNDPNEIPFYPFNDESIELYVDGDRSGGMYEGQCQSAQQWLITPENLHLLSNYPTANSIGVYAGNAVQSAIATGTNGSWTVEIEMAIYNSFETEERALAAGDTIGWDIWYNDSDDETPENNKYVRDHQTGWYYTGQAYKNSDCFGELILSQMVVPVELYAFHAEAVEKSVRLTWQTASETNNFGFDVQRSSDGIHFEKIGFVPGSGTTSSPRSYAFEDKQISKALNSYRLKILDYNGNFSFSSIIQVNLNQPEKFHLYANYPNPFNPETTIPFWVKEPCRVELTIFDLLGREIAELANDHYQPGQYQISFDASKLPSGIYFYQIQMGNFKAIKKMVLLE